MILSPGHEMRDTACCRSKLHKRGKDENNEDKENGYASPSRSQKAKSDSDIRAEANEICYKSTLARDDGCEGGRLKFKELIYSWFESLMDGGRALLHDKSGHIVQGWEWKVKEMTGIVK